MSEFWTEKQKQDIAYFDENIARWIGDPLYKTKFIIISDKAVKGVFDSFEAALSIAAVDFGVGNYIIQQVLPEDEIVNFLSPALA